MLTKKFIFLLAFTDLMKNSFSLLTVDKGAMRAKNLEPLH